MTNDFATFWSQTIGRKGKLELKCEFGNYGADNSTKAGDPHLSFWISDGLNQLYPKQRSLGVRWFVSFYLQLKASEKQGGGRVFLLDEPGANLHSKAQADVLKLVNQLSEKCQIVYSTHSPHMIEYDKLYRVLAVQRNGDDEDAPTTVIDAHKLGAASRDTLSPVLSAMGVDLSHQHVIQKNNNVILEEISGFYYLKAFWLLAEEAQEAHFIAASGTGNVGPLANMFLGWGLDFLVAVDDDSSGRAVYNDLKRNMFGDDDALAKLNMFKIPGNGIEDTFEKKDFIERVLNDSGCNFETSNSQYLKDIGRSKPILAYQFQIAVSNDTIKLVDFSEQTQKNIKKVVSEIRTRLQAKAGPR